MPTPIASSLVSGSIGALAILLAVAIVALCARGGEPAGRVRRGLIAALALAVWMSAGWILATRGVPSRFELRPPPIMLFILISVVGAVVLGRSAPMFHAFGTTPERLNTWVAFAQYIWLPSVLVPSALLGHLLVTRRLRLDPPAS